MVHDPDRPMEHGGPNAPDGTFGQFPSTYQITNFNLDDGDWVLSSVELEVQTLDLLRVISRGQPSTMTILVESADDVEFNVNIIYVGSAGNKRVEADPDIESGLTSTSPSGGNHYIFEQIGMASRFVDVRIENSTGQNRINGSLWFHP